MMTRALFLIAISLVVYCPPYWQCDGPKETNHPLCKCWLEGA